MTDPDRAPGPGGLPRAAAWLLPALLLGLVVGAALALQQPWLWPPLVYWALLCCALVPAACCALAAARPRTSRWAWALVMASPLLAGGSGAAAMFAVCGLRASGYMELALAPALEGRDIRVTGLVAAMPQTHAAGTRLRLAVETAHLQGAPVRLPPLVEVAWYGGALRGADEAVDADVQRRPPTVRAGERWDLTLRLKAPHGLYNPHGFDYELWLWEQGVQATGYVRTGPRDEAPRRLASTWCYPVEQLRQSVRDTILERLGRSVEGAETAAGGDPGRARIAGVVAALVTGDQRAIDRADWDLFRATGVAHLMSISGLHITLFAWLAALLVRMHWRRSARLCLAVPAPSAALVAGVALAAAYALFSGWGVPAQRTVIMLASVALLQLSGRRWPWPQVWLLACAAVVLVDPWALAQAGFWLSFVAVGMLFATNPVADRASASGAIGRFHALLREQWVVTLALTPLGLLLFSQVPLLGFVANLAAIPWVTLVVTPLALGGALWAPLWDLAALSLQPLMAWLQWLAQWPWAVLFLPAAPLWAGSAAVLGGALLALRMPWRLRLLALPLLWPALCWQPARPPPGQFDLLAADVGQGGAVLVRTANHTLLYDAGPRFSRESDAGQRVLVPLLRALGERVDLLMLSHRDADHSGGAAAVLAQQPQAALSGSIEAGHALQELRPVQPCLAGQRWEWDGVRFELLHPLPGDAAPGQRRAPRPNALSCVLRIAAAGAPAALLAGDIEAAQEQALVARGAALQADLLLVPHHGSKTSSSPAFLDAVRPRAALVQAGYRNRFGHPAPEVLRRYQARGIRVLESARCGAASWSSARPGVVACARDTGRRYWQHRVPPRGE
ncbi:DNA internalization-related competence protein ComEC/Rec2 [Verminephrobacter aporrectodeae]|uniref:DNA internalization-related competence protein ComEC/Rec2 n=1 Tax=Verminephrobacter aporrectodeae TaxID=1110389 RepID=UPI0022430437|nr:DNA internalization-related competence protein ComEC/Rec2 [Verminephrobacter aporrectodeae]MCW8177130.1 DNA internalization-related competence protein ComEC/Rec2 [Verminephrobacter aporrectodeae subsp. tuberculatae]MCW8204575.1 DNA internalization-related competence protein ComEC/Rec2 [Verminephrobacter aporrectodeae subsp. tuberculatae]